MTKIETGRYSERLRRALGMKGVEMVAAELSPEISPVFILEDNSIEWKFLQQVRVCTSGILQVGGAGFESLLRWSNPSISGVIAIFTHLDVMLGSLSSVNFGYATVPGTLGIPAASTVLDHRWATAASPTTIVPSRDNAGATISLSSTVFIARVLIDVAFHWDGQLVLLPGEALEFGAPGSLNLDIRANARWTERQLPALEA